MSVGEQSLCVFDPGAAEIQCGRLATGESHMTDVEVIETEPVNEFVAGPGGLVCVIRSADGQVVCRAMAGTTPPAAMLGTRHTRNLDRDVVRPVCP